jgi:2'-5' RNA ligase
VSGADERSRDDLHRVRRVLHEGADRLLLAPDRDDFSAHVTLGRARGSKGLHRLAELIREGRDRQLGRFDVPGILLVQSRLTPEGAVYSTIHEASLKGGGS